jgi:hypothetical protein
VDGRCHRGEEDPGPRIAASGPCPSARGPWAACERSTIVGLEPIGCQARLCARHLPNSGATISPYLYFGHSAHRLAEMPNEPPGGANTLPLKQQRPSRTRRRQSAGRPDVTLSAAGRRAVKPFAGISLARYSRSAAAASAAGRPRARRRWLGRHGRAPGQEIGFSVMLPAQREDNFTVKFAGTQIHAAHGAPSCFSGKAESGPGG